MTINYQIQLDELRTQAPSEVSRIFMPILQLAEDVQERLENRLISMRPMSTAYIDTLDEYKETAGLVADMVKTARMLIITERTEKYYEIVISALYEICDYYQEVLY